MLRFMFLTATLTAAALWVLGFGLHLLIKGGAGIIGGAALALAGGSVLFGTMRNTVGVFHGKTFVDRVIEVAIPGSAVLELTVLESMKRGRVIVFFQETTERYAGKVTLSKVPSDGTSPVTAALLRIVPSRVKVPSCSFACGRAKALEVWPRGTGSAAKPVVLEFTFPVCCQEKLRLEFDLESNFRGTTLEHRFPITGTEAIRVIVKE